MSSYFLVSGSGRTAAGRNGEHRAPLSLALPMLAGRSLGVRCVTQEIGGLQCDVGERVLIEGALERRQRVMQHGGKFAAPRDCALVPGSEALDQCEIRLCQPDDVADPYVLWPATEFQPTRPAANRDKIASTGQRVGHLVEMRL